MIFYNHDREVLNEFVKYNPRTCFIMTQLGEPLPKKVIEIRAALSESLKKNKIKIIDANSYVTGKDFLNKLNMSSTSLAQALATLIDKDYIYKDASGYYKLLDPMLRYLYENHH